MSRLKTLARFCRRFIADETGRSWMEFALMVLIAGSVAMLAILALQEVMRRA